MASTQLDFYFPFVVMIYGFIMTFLLHSDFFVKLAEARLDAQIWAQMRAHRWLALVCLGVGCLWSLQNLIVPPFS